MKRRTMLALAALVSLTFANSAFAYSINMTGTVTGDNHYALYASKEDGSNIRFIGRNEASYVGNPGAYNWSLPETFNFGVDPGEYLILAAWSYDVIPVQDLSQGVIGQFVYDSNTIVTQEQTWDYTVPTNPNILLNDGPAVPTNGQIAALLTGAVWQPVVLNRANGSAPWGTVAGISAGADWIWGTPGFDPGSAIGQVEVFRYKLPGSSEVPEPTSVILFAAGLMGAFRMRKRA